MVTMSWRAGVEHPVRPVVTAILALYNGPKIDLTSTYLLVFIHQS